jgi:hypothetical protein
MLLGNDGSDASRAEVNSVLNLLVFSIKLDQLWGVTADVASSILIPNEL